MLPFLDLNISDSAKAEIKSLLQDKETGSVPLLLLPVIGTDRRRIVEIGFYPPSILAVMQQEYASWGATLLYDCHGTPMAVFDEDMVAELSGKVLTHSNGSYYLAVH